MANDRMRIVCRHCGECFWAAKGYYGEYFTYADRSPEAALGYVKEWNKFLGEHGANCEKATHNADNARYHFILLCEWEDWDEDANAITNVWDDEGDGLNKTTIQMPRIF